MSSEPISRKAKNTGSDATAYVLPFVVFIALRWLPVQPELLAPLRFLLVAVSLAVFSRRVIPWRAQFFIASILLGLAVFVIWIGPDALWPHYRDFWLFRNPIMGRPDSSLPPRVKASFWFITVRVAESAVLIPILEELFWRGWLMRWLIHADFGQVPLGSYKPFSFWLTAVLFASEHGPYWEVGLIAGIAYNWWIVHTRSLADCILAHAVTNALLAAYVLAADQWQYWL